MSIGYHIQHIFTKHVNVYNTSLFSICYLVQDLAQSYIQTSLTVRMMISLFHRIQVTQQINHMFLHFLYILSKITQEKTTKQNDIVLFVQNRLAGISTVLYSTRYPTIGHTLIEKT